MMTSFEEGRLVEFIKESNGIENLWHEPGEAEIEAYKNFLELDQITVAHLEAFVTSIAGQRAGLRVSPGMDVIVGAHVPPRGGPRIYSNLVHLLYEISAPGKTLDDIFRDHVQYETLHPFMDGNGRSGRAIWLWQMVLNYRDISQVLQIPFLQRFYYQTLAYCQFPD